MTFIENFFFAKIQFRGLYVLRAALGAIAAFYYCRLLPHVPVLFGPNGINGLEAYKRFPYISRPVAENFESFTLVRYLHADEIVWSLYALLILAALSFMVGLFTRPTGILLILLHLLFSAHQPTLNSGWVKMFPTFCLYVTLCPSGKAWSVDAWRKARRGSKPSDALPSFSPWPLRLLQVHVVMMYTTVGWPRLTQPGWLNGEQVFHAMADTRFARWDLDWFALFPLLTVATYFALFMEPAASLLLPIKKTRRWAALGLLGLHSGLELTVDIEMWQFLMSAVVLSFLPDHWFSWIPGLRSNGRVAEGNPSSAPALDS